MKHEPKCKPATATPKVPWYKQIVQTIGRGFGQAKFGGGGN